MNAVRVRTLGADDPQRCDRNTRNHVRARARNPACQHCEYTHYLSTSRQDGLGCKAVAPYPGRGVTRLLCRRDPNVAPKLGAAKGIAATIVRVIPNRPGQPIATTNGVVAVLSQV